MPFAELTAEHFLSSSFYSKSAPFLSTIIINFDESWDAPVSEGRSVKIHLIINKNKQYFKAGLFRETNLSELVITIEINLQIGEACAATSLLPLPLPVKYVC